MAKNNNLDTNQNLDPQNQQVNEQQQQNAQQQVQEQDNQQQQQENGGNQQNPEPKSDPIDVNTVAELMNEIAALKVDNKRLKKATDALSSENAGLKKQVNAKMTEEELRAQQKADENDEIRRELAELRKKVSLNEATKRYMSMSMPEELAERVAQAELDGDMETVTSSINAFMQSQKKEVEEQVRADLYAKMPVPKSGNGDGQVDYTKQYQEKLASGDVAGAIAAQLMASASMQ